jgi:molybdate transport system substrate-binding protein
MVPAGMRAQEVFARLGIWNKVLAKAVRGKDVREVLSQVELGNVEAGVVYATDAAVSTKVRVVATAPGNMHKSILYPVAVLTASRQKAAANNFVRYLSTPTAQKIFKRYKFLVPRR